MNSLSIVKRSRFCFTALFLMIFLFSASQSTIAAEPLQNKSNITERIRFDAWHLKCVASKKGKERCFIDQYITGQKGKAKLASLLVNYSSMSDTPILTFKLPLGIALIPGMLYAIDAGNKFKLPLRVCTEEGCIARTVLDKKTIVKFDKGKKIDVFFYIGNNGKSISLTASLIGFQKALAALTAKQAPN